MKLKTKKWLSVLLAIIILAACSAAQSLQVVDAWARPVPAGGNGGVFFTIKNPAGQADRLMSASTPLAQAVELHMSMLSGEVMSMVPRESVEVPAGSEVEFKPGGLHVMLVGLQQELKVGDTFVLTLTFEQAGEIKVEVPVRQE